MSWEETFLVVNFAVAGFGGGEGTVLVALFDLLMGSDLAAGSEECLSR